MNEVKQPKDNRLEDNAVIHGFLCNPELKYSKNGTPIFEGSLRKPRRDGKKDGQWINGFKKIIAFNDVAMLLSEVPDKTLIQVTKGRFDLNPYTDKNGNAAQSDKILVKEFYIVEKTKEEIDDIPF